MSTKNNDIDETKKRNPGGGGFGGEEHEEDQDNDPPPTIRVLFKTSADRVLEGESTYGTVNVTNAKGEEITFDKALVTVSHNNTTVQNGTTFKITLVNFNSDIDAFSDSSPWSGASEYGKVQTGGGTTDTSTFYTYLIPGRSYTFELGNGWYYIIDSGTNSDGTYAVLYDDDSVTSYTYDYPLISTTTLDNVTSESSLGTYDVGSVIPIQVVFSNNVTVTGTPQLTLATGGGGRNVDYTSGNNTSTLLFNYTVQAADAGNVLEYLDENSLKLNGGTIKSLDDGYDVDLGLPTPGEENSLSYNKSIVISSSSTTVMSVTSLSGNGPYSYGQAVDILVNFTGTVTVTGTPQLTLETGGSSGRNVDYISNWPRSQLRFRYYVRSGDASGVNGLEYLDVNSLKLNGGTIKGADGKNVDLGLPTPGAENSLSYNNTVVISNSSTTLLRVTSSAVDGNYGVGAVIPIQVVFSDKVWRNGGPSELTLATGNITFGESQILQPGTVVQNSPYSGGNAASLGTDTLVFNYTVQENDASPKLEYLDENSLSLVDGTGYRIYGSDGKNVDLGLPTPGAVNSLSYNKNIVIEDTLKPTIAITSSTSALSKGETATITFTLSQTSTDFDVNDITVSGGALSNFTAGSVTREDALSGTLGVSMPIHARYTATFTPDDDSTTNGVISVASNTFSDASGNSNTVSNTLTITINTVKPSIAINSNKSSLKAGETATITFTLSEASTNFNVNNDITVSGGALDNFAASDPTYTATFTPNEDSTDDGVISVASGTFSDSSGNSNTVSNTVTISINTIRPTINIRSDLPARFQPAYRLEAGETTTITFTLSEVSTDFVVDDVDVKFYTLSGNANTGTYIDETTAPLTGDDEPSFTLSNFTKSAEDEKIYTATFALDDISANWSVTPVDDGNVTLISHSCAISVASDKFKSKNTENGNAVSTNFVPAGMNGALYGGSYGPYIYINAERPTITISSNESLLINQDTATITFTLSEASTSFIVGDIDVSGGSLSDFSGSGTSYTATFTPTNNGSGNCGVIRVPTDTFTNTNTNYTVNGNAESNTVVILIKSDKTYTISENFTLSDDFTLKSTETLVINSGVTLTLNAILDVTVGTVTNDGTIDYLDNSSNLVGTPGGTGNVICFYGFVNIMTEQGLKQIKDLKRGDMILTNDGYQPLAELDVGFNPSDNLLMSKLKSTDFMVKIPKDFFIENVPSEDVYVTKTHPLSVKITSADDDKDFEFLHLFVKELMQLGDGIEYVRKNSETKLYNLIFDNHYEISVGNMKFLSHHPNHLNKNKYLVEGTEQNQQNRTKKIYAIEGQCFFDTITLKDLLKQKSENMTDKEYLASVLRFD